MKDTDAAAAKKKLRYLRSGNASIRLWRPRRRLAQGGRLVVGKAGIGQAGVKEAIAAAKESLRGTLERRRRPQTEAPCPV